MIKRQIIFFIFLLGCSFSQYSFLQQTGIFAEEGEPKFGVWINASKNSSNPEKRNFKSISLDYIFPVGLEILVGYNNHGTGGSQRVERFIMSYHYKGTEKNYSMHIGKEKYEKHIFDKENTCSECSVISYGSTNVGLSWYNNKYLAIESSLVTYKNEIDHSQKINGSYILISIGKYQKINDRIIVGITYTSHLGHAHKENFFDYRLKPMIDGSMSNHLGFSFGYLY